MGFIKDFLHNFINKKEVTQYNVKPKTKSGNIDMSDSVYTKQYNQINFNSYGEANADTKYESIIRNEIKISLKEKIYPIEELISDGKNQLAIEKYEELIESIDFKFYSKDERFLIYNGLLNCYINNDAEEKTIKFWVHRIEALGEDIQEIHRYYYLLSVWHYNKRELGKAILLNEKSIKANPDYVNAIAVGILLKTTNKVISYEEAKQLLVELLHKEGLRIKDKATIHANLGDVAFNYKDFSYAKENYIESNNFSKSLTKEIGIAVCEYFESIKVMKDDGTTTLDNIDFIQLEKAKEKFETIYLSRNSDTLPSIARMVVPFLFNILSITNKHDVILEIRSRCEEYIDLSKPNILTHVIEAEVINGIYNEDTFRHLDDYERVKYQAIYYAYNKDYTTGIELLVSVLEDDYQDDKVLQLALLNALKEDNQWDRYLHYYKKFNRDNNDEILWMNYIQFLHKRDEKDKVIGEIQKLKQVVVNSFVLYDMLAILLDYNLNEELNEFFEKVDRGHYSIIGFQLPYVVFNKLMHWLNMEQYDKFFYDYENSNLEIISPINKAVLEVNYYTFKGEFDKTAKAYYELFKISENYNDLIRAVEIKLNSNSLYDAEWYLEQVQPMMLDKPELYYIYYSIILNEKDNLVEAFKKLEEIKDYAQNDLESPYHQFYSAFCMNNGKTNEAFKYMAEYYAKNPNPKWFKVIQHSDNESGAELIKKFKSVAGDRDLTQINRFFNQGVIGVAAYNTLVGTNVEEMLMYNHYPFTNVQISNGNVYKAFEEADKIDDKILVDANTLAILSESGALALLDSFKEVLIPFNAVTIVKQRQSGIMRSASRSILEYINKSLNVREVPVDVRIKIKSDSNKLLPDDTLDCIALSEQLKVPFLNTEVLVKREFHSNYSIDINTFFHYLKQNKPSTRELVAISISNLRNYKVEFISFDADDIFLCYKKNGVDGIRPYLRMGKNADYKTFPPAYIGMLKRVKDELTVEDFEKASVHFIKFMDKYVGKTRYYMSSIVRDYPEVSNDFEELIKKCSVKKILDMSRTYRINNATLNAYSEILESYEFMKILDIAVSFLGFVIQYLALFGDNEEEINKHIKFIKGNLEVNGNEDIDYIVGFITRFLNEQRDNQLQGV
ncbi:hypothetical protein [Paenibacillus sp. NPDC057967]|uniref:hypothetical protein n=1 Tax=Paenibacillus sp. NPDC057967 TaxID=3346293 RepID=UPI0036DD45AB